jgi:glyoxylase-like metal-dependent hydrolase (beta-lactamase superfamily II)
MEIVIPRLHASGPEPLGFGPDLEIRAFLLERPQGNLLVYRSERLEQEADEVRALGGISRQYLNHWHEASPACDRVAQAFGAPLVCNAADAAKVAESCHVDETFSDRHTVGDDFEAIPIPGHTPGATAFLWDTGEHRCLFTGDSLFFPTGRWVAAVLPSSDRDRYIESLELIRGLDFDVLVPWAATAGQPYHALTTAAETRRRIDAILERLARGERR